MPNKLPVPCDLCVGVLVYLLCLVLVFRHPLRCTQFLRSRRGSLIVPNCTAEKWSGEVATYLQSNSPGPIQGQIAAAGEWRMENKDSDRSVRRPAQPSPVISDTSRVS